MTLGQLWDQLQRVDWYYQMTDDPVAYRRGAQGYEYARQRSRELGVDGIVLWDEFVLHYSTHTVPGQERSELPPRPAE